MNSQTTLNLVFHSQFTCAIYRMLLYCPGFQNKHSKFLIGEFWDSGHNYYLWGNGVLKWFFFQQNQKHKKVHVNLQPSFNSFSYAPQDPTFGWEIGISPTLPTISTYDKITKYIITSYAQVVKVNKAHNAWVSWTEYKQRGLIKKFTPPLEQYSSIIFSQEYKLYVKAPFTGTARCEFIRTHRCLPE